MTVHGRALVLVVALVLPTAPCACSGGDGDGGYMLPDLVVRAMEPSIWLKGTRVRLEGTGFVPPGSGAMTATLSGEAGGRLFAVKVDVALEGPERASFTVSETLLRYLPVDQGTFAGNLALERHGDRLEGATTEAPFQVDVVSRLAPVLGTLGPTVVAPGESIEVVGDGFLLPGEGTTLLRLAGRLRVDGDPVPRNVAGVYVPVDASVRDRGAFVLTPDLLGLGPGDFEGKATVVNRIGDEDVAGGAAIDVLWQLDLPEVTSISPGRVRRGQEIVIEGRGFLPVDGDLRAATFLTFTGSRQGPDGLRTYEGVAPFVLVPDAILGNREARLLVRLDEGAEGGSDSFGVGPTTWSGRWTPHVMAGGRKVEGRGLDADVVVERTVQVVWMHFLPSFDVALDRYGLRAEAEAVRARAVEVCRGDYAGFSVDVRTEPPGDFVEFLTVELMGEDPNGAWLLGLDNSFGKDLGNLRLDDLIGGYNAAGEAAGLYAYGGVFAGSFMGFSKRLGATDLASTEFDRIFGATAPELGGREASEGEARAGGGRGEAVATAVRALGSLVGDTVTHEVGHTLGLAAVDEGYHDPGDNPGYIMDEGRYRPFEERAQLPGAYPRIFAPYDRTYLESILPAD